MFLHGKRTRWFRVVLIASAALSSTAQHRIVHAQDAIAPVYSRGRYQADDWQARGGWIGYPAYGGYGSFGYYQPWAPPVVAGTWYARPYPYHFDYYRGRWDGAIAPSADCPCADPAPQPTR